MTLLALPSELLLSIAEYLLEYLPPSGTPSLLRSNLNNLTLTNRHLHTLLTPLLLRTITPYLLLRWSIDHNRTDTALLAISLGADIGPPPPGCVFATDISTPVSYATHNRRYNMLPFLLGLGGRPTQDTLFHTIRNALCGVLQIFIDHGADLEMEYKDVGTPLRYAVLWKQAGVVMVLLRAGVKVEWGALGIESGGFERLLLERLEKGERVEMLRVLLRRGREGGGGRGERNEIGRLLWKYGARTSWEVTLENSPVWEVWSRG